MEVWIDGQRFIPAPQERDSPIPFHLLIRYARDDKSETLEEAAKMLGTTKSHLWALEKGESVPRLPMMQKIIKYYGLRFEDIAAS